MLLCTDVCVCVCVSVQEASITSWRQIVLGQKLGQGAFGVVYKGRAPCLLQANGGLLNDDTVAIKELVAGCTVQQHHTSPWGTRVE